MASLNGFAEIVVVRHGETSWNASKIIQGHLNSELNEIGRQQATAVAVRLSKEPQFVAIYSSDLKRAAETAEKIANSCGLPEVNFDPALRERHLGELQGLALRDAAKLKAEAYQCFLSKSSDQNIPGGGESLNQLYDRCTSCVERIAKKHKGERAIVVTHGGVLRELYKRAAPNSKFPNGTILNTSVNVIQISENGKWSIKMWGDISHLQDISVIKSTIAEDKNFYAV
ncbi:Histidine phosphatase superfamily clade-1 protein [Dioscorea alata]|uniref:Histidine phosphatase superfamily clade-1 protein n=1 Tax=Dioscorea alata TaxID=55571 RepID=A0ACB7U2X2_DIOAL|nr:Histidine phosphatase superfamily clade-1 protein [Dioscorea alata]